MKCSLYNFDGTNWRTGNNDAVADIQSDLVICFGAKSVLSQPGFYENITAQFKCPEIAMASTSGEILHNEVLDNSAVIAAFEFDKTQIKTACININDCTDSKEAGIRLLGKLPQENLTYLMILSDGSIVNGSELVSGLNQVVNPHVLITGGLAGDGALFTSTLTGLNNKPEPGVIVAIGFYGDSLIVKDGSEGGWEFFGIGKTVTKSAANKLYELDHQNCLDLYKRYLGDVAVNLPAAALNFPLSVLLPGNIEPVVRTILGISEEEKSMTFAGNIPEGSLVRFMKTNFNSLINAASSSAKKTISNNLKAPDFALLVSCVGRKIVLGSRTAEEVESVNQVFGGKTPLLGFYSYGEIAPLIDKKQSELHNQTMTITSFYEI
jgi:hypothetical protein